MKNPLVKLIVYAAIPVAVIFLLFKFNIFAGFAGILAYIVMIILVNRTMYYRLRGQMDYQKGNYQKAAKWFGKGIDNKKAGVELKVHYGFVLLKSGRLEEAEKALTEAVKDSKTMDEKNLAKSNLALVIWKKGELDNAYAMLKEVIEEYKTTAIYGSIGYLAIEKGDLDEALKINLEASEYNPDNAIIQDNLAHLYHLRGEKEKAEEIFKKLMEKSPHFPEAYFDYGKLLEDYERYEEAAAMYNKALSCTFSFNGTITKEEVQRCLTELKRKVTPSN